MDWLSTGVIDQPLNHDADRVWWLSTPGYRTPTLWQIDKQTARVSSRPDDLLLGKVFGDPAITRGPRPTTKTIYIT